MEADETYVGGRLRQAPGQTKRDAAAQRLNSKTPLVSLVERGGTVRSQVMPRVTGENIAKVLRGNVEPAAELQRIS